MALFYILLASESVNEPLDFFGTLDLVLISHFVYFPGFTLETACTSILAALALEIHEGSTSLVGRGLSIEHSVKVIQPISNKVAFSPYAPPNPIAINRERKREALEKFLDEIFAGDIVRTGP
ncbi:MAG TPA: hypothetical protein VKC60_08130 [Opitutaceae bacterium]|nr:hypothetical protein [Opitutaceae bacterium]